MMDRRTFICMASAAVADFQPCLFEELSRHLIEGVRDYLAGRIA
jgi:hypothetical protein